MWPDVWVIQDGGWPPRTIVFSHVLANVPTTGFTRYRSVSGGCRQDEIFVRVGGDAKWESGEPNLANVGKWFSLLSPTLTLSLSLCVCVCFMALAQSTSTKYIVINSG